MRQVAYQTLSLSAAHSCPRAWPGVCESSSSSPSADGRPPPWIITTDRRPVMSAVLGASSSFARQRSCCKDTGSASSGRNTCLIVHSAWRRDSPSGRFLSCWPGVFEEAAVELSHLCFSTSPSAFRRVIQILEPPASALMVTYASVHALRRWAKPDQSVSFGLSRISSSRPPR